MNDLCLKRLQQYTFFYFFCGKILVIYIIGFPNSSNFRYEHQYGVIEKATLLIMPQSHWLKKYPMRMTHIKL